MTVESILAEASTLLSSAEFVTRLALHRDLPAARPWGIVQPDYVALRVGEIGNVFEAVRFRVENAACRLPVAQRPRGLTLLREGESLPTDDRQIRETIASGKRIAPSIPAASSELSPAWQSVFSRALPAAASRVPLQSNTSLEFDLDLDSLDRLAFFYTVAAQLSADIRDEDKLNASHTLADVIAYFGRQPDALLERTIAPGPEAYFSHLAPVEAPHFSRPATATWPVVAATRVLLRLWAKQRLDLRVIGLDRVDWARRPLIVAQNHQSVIDAPLLAAALPASVHRRLLFLGFAGYFSRGPGKLASRLFRVHPCSADAGLAAGFRAGARALKAGMTLAIYPEGERTWDGTLRPLKRGVAWLARETGAAVVPSAIVGSYEAWPRGWPFHAHPVRVAFGRAISAPMPGSGLAEERAFLGVLRSAISDLMLELGGDPIGGSPDVWAHGPPTAPRRTRARA